MQSDEFVPYEQPFTYDRSQNPIDESDLADKLIWDETTNRFTFFKPHLKKGMSCHSTKPFDHSDREKANHSPEILALPRRPTFVDPERAQWCCGNAKKENYRVDCKAPGCLVKCPHPDCGGGVGEQAVQKCPTCPLALPALDRMPSHCLCGVRFLMFAPFVFCMFDKYNSGGIQRRSCCMDSAATSFGSAKWWIFPSSGRSGL